MSLARYLGDGVYAEYDGYSMLLKVGSHTSPTLIVIEPDVQAALNRFWEEAVNTARMGFRPALSEGGQPTQVESKDSRATPQPTCSKSCTADQARLSGEAVDLRTQAGSSTTELGSGTEPDRDEMSLSEVFEAAAELVDAGGYCCGYSCNALSSVVSDSSVEDSRLAVLGSYSALYAGDGESMCVSMFEVGEGEQRVSHEDAKQHRIFALLFAAEYYREEEDDSGELE